MSSFNEDEGVLTNTGDQRSASYSELNVERTR